MSIFKKAASWLGDNVKTNTDYVKMAGSKLGAWSGDAKSMMRDEIAGSIGEGMTKISNPTTGLRNVNKNWQKSMGRNSFDAASDFLKNTKSSNNIMLQNATLQGAASGAVGGMTSAAFSDDGFIEGGIKGAALGAVMGGGAKGFQMHKKSKGVGQYRDSARRARAMRKTDQALNVSPDETVHRGFMGDYTGAGQRNKERQSQRKSRSKDKANVKASISSEEAKMKAIRANGNAIHANINPWATGGLAAAGSLAWATLGSNHAI